MTLFEKPNSSFPIAFTIANLPIYWYAIFTLIGYLTAITIFLIVSSKRYKISYEVPFYYIFWAIPAILFGARLWSVIIGDASATRFFHFREGGLAIQGGVVAGIIVAMIYFPIVLRSPKHHIKVYEKGNVYIKRPSIWLYADAIIPTILIGQAIGRWGNFFNGEIFGQRVDPSELIWLKDLMPGVYNHMTPETTMTINGLGSFQNGIDYFQPLFLYESFLNVVSFIIIYIILAELNIFKAGTIASLYFIDYGTIRFITESLRFKEFTFKGTYVINSILFTIGILMFIYCEWIAPKFRQYQKFVFIKDKIINFFDNNKKEIKINNYVLKESQMLYYANR